MEKNLRGLCLVSEDETPVKNWNSYAVLKMNSFW